MFFRVVYTLKHFDFGDLPKIILKFKAEESEVSIEFDKITKEKLKTYEQLGEIKCIANLEKKISAKQIALFAEMKKDIPTGLAQRIFDISTELDLAIATALKIFRWRRGVATMHNIIKYGGNPAFSFDGEKWQICPQAINLGVTADLPLPKKSLVDECNDLLAEGAKEPLGHELFAEAWSIRQNSPRSSLAIGIAALETGFKECVNKLAPETDWFNIKSPPIVKMLSDLLPSLSTVLKINGKVLPPPKTILKTLINGVVIRNQIIHGNPQNLRADTLEKVLRAIRDVLYLLDFYGGHLWAERFISIDTKKLLIEDSKK